jgi:hypothetical protein
MHISQHFCYFYMNPESRFLLGCSAQPANLPPSPQLCQNGGLSIVTSIRDGEKNRVGGIGGDSHVVFEKIPGDKGSVSGCVVVTQQPVPL